MKKRKNTKNPFTQNLNQLLDEKDIGIREASRLAGVGPSTIMSWKSGALPEDYMAVKRLAESLGTTMSFLLTGELDNLKTATDSMPAKRIKLSSNKTYGSKVTGKFGFIKFIEAYNNVTGQTYEVNPPSPNIHDRIKDYLHLRALEGNNNAFKIQMSRSGQPVDFSTVQGDYAAILGYYDNLGYLERTNPCRHPSFQFYLT